MSDQDKRERRKHKRGHGEGSIYKMKDGRWRGAVSVGWKQNKSGEPIWKRKIVTGTTRYDVQEELKKILRDQQRGINIDPEKLTVAEYLKRWVDGTKSDVSRHCGARARRQEAR